MTSQTPKIECYFPSSADAASDSVGTPLGGSTLKWRVMASTWVWLVALYSHIALCSRNKLRCDTDTCQGDKHTLHGANTLHGHLSGGQTHITWCKHTTRTPVRGTNTRYTVQTHYMDTCQGDKHTLHGANTLHGHLSGGQTHFTRCKHTTRTPVRGTNTRYTVQTHYMDTCQGDKHMLHGANTLHGHLSGGQTYGYTVQTHHTDTCQGDKHTLHGANTPHGHLSGGQTHVTRCKHTTRTPVRGTNTPYMEQTHYTTRVMGTNTLHVHLSEGGGTNTHYTMQTHYMDGYKLGGANTLYHTSACCTWNKHTLHDANKY